MASNSQDKRKFTHHDNPPWWLIELREKSPSFCGCYEGDLGGEWDSSAPLESADYTVGYGTHKYHYQMGEGQKWLKALIERVEKA